MKTAEDSYDNTRIKHFILWIAAGAIFALYANNIIQIDRSGEYFQLTKTVISLAWNAWLVWSVVIGYKLFSPIYNMHKKKRKYRKQLHTNWIKNKNFWREYFLSYTLALLFVVAYNYLGFFDGFISQMLIEYKEQDAKHSKEDMYYLFMLICSGTAWTVTVSFLLLYTTNTNCGRGFFKDKQ